MKSLLLVLFLSPIMASATDLGSSYKKGTHKLLITKKTFSTLLEKTTESSGTLYVAPGKLRLESKEALVLVNGDKLTVVSFGDENKNHVLKGTVEKGFLKDLTNFDFKSCTVKDSKALCGPSTFVFKGKELELIEHVDEVENKTSIVVKKNLFNTKEKVSFEYVPSKKDEVQELNSLEH